MVLEVMVLEVIAYGDGFRGEGAYGDGLGGIDGFKGDGAYGDGA